jgi:D-glutamate N-acetyltransferase
MQAPLAKTPAVAASTTIEVRRPYLLFLGEVEKAGLAKTAFGLRDWAGEACLGQWSLPGCKVSLDLPELNPAAAAARGAASLVIGVAPVGGRVAPSWVPALFEAVEAGLDIVSGMHSPLAEVPGLAAAAQRRGVRLVDVRRPPAGLPTGTGRKRSGKRLLTVGTDCALGKKYTALALAGALRKQGIDADFRASGQTGILIAGSGIPLDAVVADFCAGAAECLSPDAAPGHWDIVEGQGSLFHPAYAGVTLGLVHGSQPDALVLCHDPSRTQILALESFPTPQLPVAIERYLEAARLTNPAVRMVGISFNTSSLDAAARARLLAETEQALGLPCFDPLKTSLDGVLQRILAL